MKSIPQIHLADVQNVYAGPEGRLWQLLMGEQIHIGGLTSSMDLAERAGIAEGWSGVDFCCALGAGMRFLVKFCGVASMRGVDATAKVVERGQQRCQAAGLDKQIGFTLGNVCASGLPSASADFVWGEDAWCYVEDKTTLIAEAARLVKPGGLIAFTDWVEGPAGLSAAASLALKGYAVVVYEKMPEPGGLLRYGIPDHRLSQELLDHEIGLIRGLGVRFECNQPIKTQDELERLLQGGYDAVFLATEAGHNALSIFKVDLTDWEAFLEACRELAGV